MGTGLFVIEFMLGGRLTRDRFYMLREQSGELVSWDVMFWWIAHEKSNAPIERHGIRPSTRAVIVKPGSYK